MKKQFSFLLFFSFFAFSISNAQVIVKVRPPHPPQGVKPPKPQPGFIWVDGDWHYSRRYNRYVWMPGHWTKPIKGFVWVEGHWESGSWGHKWMPGHWAREIGSNAANQRKKK